MKKTKILATIGPSSWKPKILRQLIKQGVNGIRINTAHGDFKQYATIINRVRTIKDLPIVLDIKGPELRLRVKEEIKAIRGKTLEINYLKKGDVHFDYNISKKVRTKDTIYFDNGRVKAKIIQKKKNSLVVKFYNTGTIGNDKGVNIPVRNLDLPALSKKDKEAINFAKRNKVAFIALSFTRSAKDIQRLRKVIHKDCEIIAKIESREGIENITEIIDAADGIMIARGDLGVELDIEKVPIVQKEIIKECSNKGKLVITATQMLESMVKSISPTRAEVSDIANAILDGSDCIMLSEETAIGSHPIEAVKVMSKVCVTTEQNRCPMKIETDPTSVTEQIGRFSYELATMESINKIITLTSTGYSAKVISRFKSNDPIIAITHHEYTSKQLELNYGVTPVLCKTILTTPKAITRILLNKKLISKKDRILITRVVTQNKSIKLIQDIHYVKNL